MLTIIFFWFDARRISRGMGATAFLARFGRKRTDAVFTLCRNCSRNKMIKINLAKFMDAHGFIMRAPWLMLSRSKWPKEKKKKTYLATGPRQAITVIAQIKLVARLSRHTWQVYTCVLATRRNVRPDRVSEFRDSFGTGAGGGETMTSMSMFT